MQQEITGQLDIAGILECRISTDHAMLRDWILNAGSGAVVAFFFRQMLGNDGEVDIAGLRIGEINPLPVSHGEDGGGCHVTTPSTRLGKFTTGDPSAADCCPTFFAALN